MKTKKSLIVVSTIVLIFCAGALYFLFGRGDAHARAADSYAQAAAASLAAGRLPAGLDLEDPALAQTKLATTLEGMGEIPHTVTVGSVTLDDQKDSGTISFEHAWTVHADKPAWTYRTTMPITRHGDAWRGAWSNVVVEPTLTESERLRATRLDATRGEIFGNDDSTLVTERPVRRVGISRPDTTSPEQAEASARALAALVEIDPEPYAASVAAAGPQAFVEAIVYRDQSEELTGIAEELSRIPGAIAIADSRPLAPSSTFAAPILGRVGQATAEIVEKSNGAVRAGDRVGLSGLQLSQNKHLAGLPGFEVQALPVDGGQGRTLHKVDPKKGQDLTTTLDLRTQEAAELALKQVQPPSAIVAVRPSDGHVLGAASGPGGQGYSTALLGQYPPGSTFKAVTSLALLRAGLTPETPLECSATVTVDGRSFKNYDNYPAARLGRIPFRDVFANSCNTGLISARNQLSPDSLAQAAASLGLTSAPSLGVPSVLGAVPSTNGETDLAASEIGQGRVVSSPLGMATVAASIAAGHRVQPILVTNPRTSSTAPASGPEVTTQEAGNIRELMRRVVTDGSATFLQGVPGPPVAAKTGTAEYGSDAPPKTHAWMIAIQGDLAVAVFVEDGAGGARTAGPILSEFLTSVAGDD